MDIGMDKNMLLWNIDIYSHIHIHGIKPLLKNYLKGNEMDGLYLDIFE